MVSVAFWVVGAVIMLIGCSGCEHHGRYDVRRAFWTGYAFVLVGALCWCLAVVSTRTA